MNLTVLDASTSFPVILSTAMNHDVIVCVGKYDRAM